MIAQDIVHSATHGRVKTPKHVALGMSVRHITGLAREILASTESCGVVIPTNIYHLVHLFKLLVTTMMSTRKPWMERIPHMPQHLFSTGPASLDQDPPF